MGENEALKDAGKAAVTAGIGAGAGAAANATIGGIGVAVGGSAFGIPLAGFIIAGAVIGVIGYYAAKGVTQSLKEKGDGSSSACVKARSRE